MPARHLRSEARQLRQQLHQRDQREAGLLRLNDFLFLLPRPPVQLIVSIKQVFVAANRCAASDSD